MADFAMFNLTESKELASRIASYKHKLECDLY